jgi:hypothetical protein
MPSARTTTIITPLLWAGIAAVVIYAAGDLISGLLYKGYKFRHQAISELTAYRSPVRPLMMAVMIIHSTLVAAFGLGLLMATTRSILRWTGGLLIGASVVTLPTHTVWAMSSRGMETGANDQFHALTTTVFSVLVAAAIVSSAIAYRGWFRALALVTLFILVVFGVAAANAMTGLATNHTLWAGAFERINCYAYFGWLVMLAITVMRESIPASLHSR